MECFRSLIVMLVLSSNLLGCSTLTAVRSKQTHRTDKATFEDYEGYYFWGLAGKAMVNTQDICKDRPIDQIQSLYTVEDALFIFFTAGIYTPRTYRVWCGEKQEARQ